MALFTYNLRNLDAAVRRLLNGHTAIRHRAMAKAADYMREEAQRRCPVDEGNLTDDIMAGTEAHAKSESAVVYVPVNAPSGKYAIPMHEHDYNLGENSRAKQAKLGVAVGKGYLTRAITENMQEIEDGIVETLRNGLEGMA